MWSDTHHQLVLVLGHLGRDSGAYQCQALPMTGPGLQVWSQTVIHHLWLPLLGLGMHGRGPSYVPRLAHTIITWVSLDLCGGAGSQGVIWVRPAEFIRPKHTIIWPFKERAMHRSIWSSIYAWKNGPSPGPHNSVSGIPIVLPILLKSFQAKSTDQTVSRFLHRVWAQQGKVTASKLGGLVHSSRLLPCGRAVLDPGNMASVWSMWKRSSVQGLRQLPLEPHPQRYTAQFLLIQVQSALTCPPSFGA